MIVQYAPQLRPIWTVTNSFVCQSCLRRAQRALPPQQRRSTSDYKKPSRQPAETAGHNAGLSGVSLPRELEQENSTYQRSRDIHKWKTRYHIAHDANQETELNPRKVVTGQPTNSPNENAVEPKPRAKRRVSPVRRRKIKLARSTRFQDGAYRLLIRREDNKVERYAALARKAHCEKEAMNVKAAWQDFGHSSRNLAGTNSSSGLDHSRGLSKANLPHSRSLHTTAKRRNEATAVDPDQARFEAEILHGNSGGIRERLAKWHALHGETLLALDYSSPTPSQSVDGLTNETRLPADVNDTILLAPGPGEDDSSVSLDLNAPLEEITNPIEDERRFAMGDLIRFFVSNYVTIIGIYVRPAAGYVHQVFGINGQALSIPTRSFQYAVPGFVTPQEVEPIIKYMPSDTMTVEEHEEYRELTSVHDLSVPRSASGPLMTKLFEFEKAALEVFRKSASRWDNAHAIVSEQSRTSSWTLRDLAATVLQKPAQDVSEVEMYAADTIVKRDSLLFVPDTRSYRWTEALQVPSQEHSQSLEMVRSWIVEWQNNKAAQMAKRTHGKAGPRLWSKNVRRIDDFVERAKAMVHRSRKDRDPTVCGLGPSKARLTGVPCAEESPELTLEFTLEDTPILQFLEAWALHQQTRRSITMNALAPQLIKATNLYPEYPIDRVTGKLFLAECGIISPYENPDLFDTHLCLPDPTSQTQRDRLQTQAEKRDFRDSMAALRHDWRDHRVFCIDDASAREIDDGISIQKAAELVDGHPTHWIHIHIANPTAFIDKEDEVAKNAARLGESIYVPEATWPMMPDYISQKLFSLAPDRPALTFSARLDRKGNTVEHKITPGTLRDVVRLTYSHASRILGNPSNDTTRKEYLLTVGGSPKARQPAPEPHLTQSDVNDLDALHRLALARFEKRKNDGGVFYDSSKADITVDMDDTSQAGQKNHAYGEKLSRKDPVIQMRVRSFSNYFDAVDVSAAQVLVREMMLLACEIGGTWCAERQIPIPFRGTGSGSKTSDITPEKFYREQLVPIARANGGKFPYHKGFQYVLTFGPTITDTRPLRHQILGMSHYCKVTSPLRRYGDMITHWQIESALRYEAQHGLSLRTDDPNADRTFTPFSAIELKEILKQLQPRERLIMSTKSRAIDHWRTQLFFRAFHFGERTDSHIQDGQSSEAQTMARLPTVFHIMIDSEKNFVRGASGVIIEFNLKVSQLIAPLSPDGQNSMATELGDIWEAKIDSVNPYNKSVVFVLTRLVYRLGQDGYAGWFGSGPPLDLFGETSSTKPEVLEPVNT